MKLMQYSLYAAVFVLALSSCNDENPWLGNDIEGGLQISVKADADVTDALPTRATALAPDVNDFMVRLTSADASYSGQWMLSEWDNSRGFHAGEYSLEAYYGDLNEEGYDKPYYHGQTSVNVRPGDVTQAAVTASLANTMVSISYTDAFKNYFSKYSTQLHSEGHDFVNLDPSRDDAVYLAPGKVTVTVDITKNNGKQATIQPAEFTAEARHHYHLTLDVNGGQVGDGQLVVKFDDTLVQEDVEIDLSDELFDVSAPEVTPQGFTPGVPVDVLEQTVSGQAPRFSIYAPGKMSAVTLTIESDTWEPPFGKEIDLLAASSAEQSQLEDLGFKVRGLFHNPDKMAYIDMADVLTNLPSGSHKFTLVVKDRLTRVNEPVTMSVNAEAVLLSLVSTPSLPYGAAEGTLQVEYNGENFADNVTIEAQGDNGVFQKCEIKNAKRAVRTRTAFPANTYDVTISLPFSSNDMPVRLLYRGKEMASGTIIMYAPNYTLAADAFAKKAVLYVEADSKEHVAAIVNNLRLFENGTEVAPERLLRDNEAGTVTLSGVNSSTSYSFTSSAMKGNNPAPGASVSFTTEAELQPNNGNMDAWASVKAYVGQRWFANSDAANSYWATRNITTTAQTGGMFGAGGYDYTCKSGTYPVDNGSGKAACIETIGWGRGTTTTGSSSTVKNISAGMLFMGDHNYTGKDTGSSLTIGSHEFDPSLETISYGRPFTSRPSSVQFDYKFASYNGESFKAYVVFENRDGGKVTELARKELVSNADQNDFTTVTLPLSYPKMVKATHAYVVFISSTADNPAVNKVGVGGGYHKGTVLTVDNIKFNY